MANKILGLIYDHWAQIWATKAFYINYLCPSYHYLQFKGKLMNWNWENGEKPNFGANFELLGPKLGSQFFFFMGFTSTLLDVRHKLDMSQAIIVCNFKENIWSKLKKMTKTSLWAWFRPIGPKFGLSLFLKKNIWICQSLDMVSYHHLKYQKKLKIQSQENFVMEKEMDGRTEKQKDESDFIGHCPNDFKHPRD